MICKNCAFESLREQGVLFCRLCHVAEEIENQDFSDDGEDYSVPLARRSFQKVASIKVNKQTNKAEYEGEFWEMLKANKIQEQEQEAVQLFIETRGERAAIWQQHCDFEKEKSSTTMPASSSAASGGNSAPRNRRSSSKPSSMIGTPCRSAISRMRRRRARLVLVPSGLWKLGIV